MIFCAIATLAGFAIMGYIGIVMPIQDAIESWREKKPPEG